MGPVARERRDPRVYLVLAFFAAMSLGTVALLKLQPAGIDFLALWTGGQVATLNLPQLYDAAHLTELQGWPLGHGIEGLRPFPYPPTALLLFVPLGALPWLAAYGLWGALSLALFAYAGRRAGAPWWFLLYPWVAFALYCGQVTLFLGSLVILGLCELRTRPLLASVCFGVAAAIKPQLVIALPFALILMRQWRVFFATGLVGLAVCEIALLLWGAQPWLAWLSSLPGFSEQIAASARLTANGITPASALRHFGLNPAWAVVTLAPAGYLIWWAFRREGRPVSDQVLALFGAGFLVAPYAMHYELALFAPAVAVYLARTKDRGWLGYLLASVVSSVALHPMFVGLLSVLSLPVTGWASRRRERQGNPALRHG